MASDTPAHLWDSLDEDDIKVTGQSYSIRGADLILAQRPEK
jgi:hypothetical protein